MSSVTQMDFAKTDHRGYRAFCAADCGASKTLSPIVLVTKSANAPTNGIYVSYLRRAMISVTAAVCDGRERGPIR